MVNSVKIKLDYEGGKTKRPIELSLKEEGIKSEWHTPATALTLLRAEPPRR